MRAVMGALAVLCLLQAAATIGQGVMLASAIASLWNGEGVGAVASTVAAFFACFAVLQLVRFAQETMLDHYSLAQAQSLREQLLAATFDGQTLLARSEGTAVVATAATEGVDEIQTYLRIIPPKLVGMVLVSLPILVAVFVVDWPSGVILAVMFPVIIFFMVLLGRQARTRAERQYGAYTRLANRFMDTLRGLDALKSFGATEVEGASVHMFSERLRKATVRTLTTATLSSAVLDLCATFGVAAVAMMLAFRLMNGSVALATGLTALILSPEYFLPIRSFAGDFHASLDGKNALAAVFGMVDGNRDAEGASVSGGERHDLVEVSDAGGGRGFDVESVEFCDVAYRYPDTDSGVEGLSFTLQRPQLVAVVGKSGSGKTTLANLLAGFVEPTDGQVLVDGDALDLTSAAWKRHVRYIPQHPYVFRGTLADNVAFYCPTASRDRIEAAVRAVGLSELASELPDGLDTLVGEGARGLSGGQAHRVALARIMLDDDARVLVLDEPTAHLDLETELDLKRQMLSAFSGKLVVIATHRLHWTHDADVVIELEDGKAAGLSLADDGLKKEVGQ